MEQLSLFDFSIEVEKKGKIIFTPETEEELILLMSQAIYSVYNKLKMEKLK